MPLTLNGNGTGTGSGANTGQPAATALPLKAPKLKADTRKEYVAGGAYSFQAGGYFRALPQYIDDVTADFGDDLYERMERDPQVAAAVNIIRLGALAQGLTLLNPIEDKSDPEWERGEEILQFCRRNFRRLQEPLIRTLFQLLSGVAYGHKVAELIYEVPGRGEDAGKLCLKAIKVKARRTTAFVVDPYHNVIGLLGLLPGLGMSSVITTGLISVGNGNGNGAGANGSGAPANLLPREKFVVFTFRPQDSDPRGTSILRPAYDPWWCKQQIKPEYLKYLAQFAGPSLVGFTPENATAQPVSDSLGNPVPTNGTQEYLTPEELMLDALLAAKNGTAMAFPYGSDVKPLHVQGDGSAFTRAFAHFNEEITRAILYQTLATNEGLHQARASSETHENVLDMVIRETKETLRGCIINDILWPLVAYNFGDEEADRLCPDVALAEMGNQDFALNTTAVAQLYKAGYVHTSQLPGLDAMLGLPERDMEAQLAEEEEAKQQAQQLAEQPPGEQEEEEGEQDAA